MGTDERTEFGPRCDRQAWQAVVCLALGGVALAPQAARVGHAFSVQGVNLLAVGVLLAAGAATLLALARGRPRLGVDRRGLTLHGDGSVCSETQGGGGS